MIALPEVDLERCTGCGDCVELCPTGAAELVDGRMLITRPEDCDYCTECEGVCPFKAVRCPFQILLEVGADPLPEDGQRNSLP